MILRIALLTLCLLVPTLGQGDIKIPAPFAEWKEVRVALGIVPFHKDGLVTLSVNNPNGTICPMELNYDANTRIESGNTKATIKDGEEYFVMYVDGSKYALLMVRGGR